MNWRLGNDLADFVEAKMSSNLFNDINFLCAVWPEGWNRHHNAVRFVWLGQLEPDR
jgi:hypothetical protein